jgi:hypothetical protein
MKALIMMIGFLIAFNSFSHDHTEGVKAKLSFFPEELGFADKVSTKYIKVVGGNLTGFNKVPSERARVVASYEVIEQVVNSHSFKSRVINFRNSLGQRSFSSNRGMSNEQIYDFLMEGREIIRGEQTLGEMNFDVNRYYRGWSKVIGYVNMGRSNTIHVNGKFYSRYSISQVASNLTHEWIHLKGFTHDSARDHDSVPYAIGYIVEELAREYLAKGFID